MDPLVWLTPMPVAPMQLTAACTWRAAMVWGWLVEKNPPDRRDLIGAAVCLVGIYVDAV